MSLYHFFNKKNKVKSKAENIYFQIINISKEYINEINHPINQDFKTTFEIFCLFLIMYFKISKELRYDKFEKVNIELMKIFTKDLENYFRELGIGDMSIGKYVKSYIKKFYYRIKKLDLIYDSKKFEEINEFLTILEDKVLIQKIANSILQKYIILKNEMKNNKIGGYFIE